MLNIMYSPSTTPSLYPLIPSLLPTSHGFSYHQMIQIHPPRTLCYVFSDNRFPALSWVPVSPWLDSKPLSVLKSYPRDYGICKVRQQYRLDPQLVNEWTALERNLIFISLKISSITDCLLPLEWEFFPLPSNYGFQHAHKSLSGTCKAAQKSLDAFGPLMGWASFILSHHCCPTQNGLLPWELLLANAGLPNDAITQLANCELLDFKPDYQRAGVVITRDCKFKEMANLWY